MFAQPVNPEQIRTAHKVLKPMRTTVAFNDSFLSRESQPVIVPKVGKQFAAVDGRILAADAVRI